MKEDSPVKDLLYLVFGVLLLLAIAYSALDFVSNFISQRVSFKQEKKLSEYFFSKIKTPSGSLPIGRAKENGELTRLIRELWAPYNKENLTLDVSVIPGPPNAFTQMGGNFMVTDKLLSSVGSENELAFVLCHELGHYQKRHILSGMSRSLVTYVFLLFTGLSDQNTATIELGTKMSELSHRRAHETEADDFALDCMMKRYGHVNGYKEFFVKLMRKKGFFENNKTLNFFMTHPLSEDRIAQLKRYALSHSMPVQGKLTPLAGKLN